MDKMIMISFEDEEQLQDAVLDLQNQNIKITDLISPFPIHGLDELLGLKRSRIPVVAFIGGAIGAVLSFVFQAWAFVLDYPLIIGGKPHLSIPSFIPISFEITILFAAISMVLVFFISSNIGPGARTRIYKMENTDNLFTIVLSAIDIKDAGMDFEKLILRYDKALVENKTMD
ncbi:MAG: DUF3341 domain-containing protein [Marinifilaceae bacterium]|jgi:hypothetical protein|nr:DUF3341 domain-containing protein [Marinifilaceae bacterium]